MSFVSEMKCVLCVTILETELGQTVQSIFNDQTSTGQ